MTNQETEAARLYHAATKLSYINLGNKPSLYKSYLGFPKIPLPTELPSPQMPTLAAVAGAAEAAGDLAGGAGSGKAGDTPLDLGLVAQLLLNSAGLVRQRVLPAGEVHYRAAASAGALYPIDVYLVCQDLSGLEAGVYHFSPADFSLRRLRGGDHRAALVAAARDPIFAIAPAILVFTATFWRSAWKYRARGYRYCFWDCGTILANLMAVGSALGLPARLVAGFIDEQVDRLLGISGEGERSICIVPLGRGAAMPPVVDYQSLAPLAAESGVALEDGIEYPEAGRLHLASCLTTGEEVVAWRAPRSGAASGRAPGGLTVPPPPGQKDGLSSNPLGEAILARGSTRRFARVAISHAQLHGILASSTRGAPADFRATDGPDLLDFYTVVHSVEGVPPGSYFYSARHRRLELLREGDFREEAGHLCFEQALGADASAVTFFLADLEAVYRRLGNRGYRAAQLEAGLVGGYMYLCAHSLGLGATGMTFYDDEVTEFFSPHARGKSVMFLVATGVAGRPNRVRPFRSRVAVTLDSLARGAT